MGVGGGAMGAEAGPTTIGYLCIGQCPLSGSITIDIFKFENAFRPEGYSKQPQPCLRAV